MQRPLGVLKTMARTLKPQEVGKVVDERLHITVPIMLDRNKLSFYGEFNNEKVEASTAEECKTLVLAKIREQTQLTWIPVILVGYDKPSVRHIGLYSSVSFQFERFEKARRPDGQWSKRPHEEEYQERLKASGKGIFADTTRRTRAAGNDVQNYWPPATEKVQDRGIRITSITQREIPYDDVTWQALNEIKASLDLAAARIASIVEDEKLGEKLKLMGANILHALPEKADS